MSTSENIREFGRSERGDVEAKAAEIREKMRREGLSEARVTVAAKLGEPSARIALSIDDEVDVVKTIQELAGVNDGLIVRRLVVELARSVVDNLPQEHREQASFLLDHAENFINKGKESEELANGFKEFFTSIPGYHPLDARKNPDQHPFVVIGQASRCLPGWPMIDNAFLDAWHYAYLTKNPNSKFTYARNGGKREELEEFLLENTRPVINELLET